MLKKQMSDEQKNALTYIQQHESTSVSYVKVGNSAKNLVVSFAGNAHSGFARKSSLMQLKYQRNDFDVIYFRNKDKWYLGGLNGIGKNINHTIAFLKTEFASTTKLFVRELVQVVMLVYYLEVYFQSIWCSQAVHKLIWIIY